MLVLDKLKNKETGEIAYLHRATGRVYSPLKPAGLGLNLSMIGESLKTVPQQKTGFFETAGNFVKGLFVKPDGSTTTFNNIFEKVASNVTFNEGKFVFNRTDGTLPVATPPLAPGFLTPQPEPPAPEPSGPDIKKILLFGGLGLLIATGTAIALSQKSKKK